MAAAERARERAATPVRTTPDHVAAAASCAFWTSLSGPADDVQPSARAQAVLDCLRTHGASFFEELVEATGLLRPQVEEALGELVALGLVNSDSFGGLRALAGAVGPAQAVRRRHAAAAHADVRHGGRRPLGADRRAPPDANAHARPRGAIEHVARTLLRRYGVVFWRLLAREADWLPPWRDLLRVYRRLEARGEIRGGRFVAGFSGEQYALPEAIGMLREVRRQPPFGRIGLAVRRGSAQPCRHPDAGAEAGGADRQPPAVPRWPAGRVAGRRRGASS